MKKKSFILVLLALFCFMVSCSIDPFETIEIENSEANENANGELTVSSKGVVRPYLRINNRSTSTIGIGLYNGIVLHDYNKAATGYFVSIQLSDPSWNRYGTEYMEWLSSTDSEAIQKGKFDLVAFCSKKGLTLKRNSYYRVKIATTGNWREDSKLIYIKPLKLMINNKNGLNLKLGLWSGIMMRDISRSATGYFVSVQLSDPSWTRYGREYMEWLSPQDNENITNGRFKLEDFCTKKGLSLTPGKYYVVKLATNYGWNSNIMLLYINKPRFLINGSDAYQSSVPLTSSIGLSDENRAAKEYSISISESSHNGVVLGRILSTNINKTTLNLISYCRSNNFILNVDKYYLITFKARYGTSLAFETKKIIKIVEPDVHDMFIVTEWKGDEIVNGQLVKNRGVVVPLNPTVYVGNSYKFIAYTAYDCAPRELRDRWTYIYFLKNDDNQNFKLYDYDENKYPVVGYE